MDCPRESWWKAWEGPVLFLRAASERRVSCSGLGSGKGCPQGVTSGEGMVVTLCSGWEMEVNPAPLRIPYPLPNRHSLSEAGHGSSPPRGSRGPVSPASKAVVCCSCLFIHTWAPPQPCGGRGLGSRRHAEICRLLWRLYLELPCSTWQSQVAV